MTGLEIAKNIGEVLTGTAAIVAGIKAWLADNKSKRIEKDVSEIKIAIAQQQAQKQSQNITVNVATSAGSPITEAASRVILSAEEPQ